MALFGNNCVCGHVFSLLLNMLNSSACLQTSESEFKVIGMLVWKVFGG